MTLTAASTKVSYTGDGTTVAFPVTFKFFGQSELEVRQRVIATGAETVLSLGTHYTVTGGNGSTGTVTAVTAPAATVRWTIARKTLRQQLVDLVDGDAFGAETVERVFDRHMALCQEIEELASRGLFFPLTDGSISGQLPNSVERAGKYLVFDGSGLPGVAAGPGIAAFLVSTSLPTPAAAYHGGIATLTGTGLADRVYLGGRSAAGAYRWVDLLGLPSLLSAIDPAEHNGIRAGTSTFDCTAALKAELQAMKVLRVPAGTYKLDSWASSLNLPAGTYCLVGDGVGATVLDFGGTSAGTVFNLASVGTRFELANMTIKGADKVLSVGEATLDELTIRNVEGVNLSGGLLVDTTNPTSDVRRIRRLHLGGITLRRTDSSYTRDGVHYRGKVDSAFCRYLDISKVERYGLRFGLDVQILSWADEVDVGGDAVVLGFRFDDLYNLFPRCTVG